MERTPTRYRLTPRSVFEVPLDNGRVGFCHIIRNDPRLAELCALYWGMFEPGTPVENVVHDEAEVLGIAYINSASARQRGWRKITKATLPPTVQLPEAFFHGDDVSNWKIVFGSDGRTEVLHGEKYTRDELLARGWVDKVLWLSEDFERAFLTNRMPRWELRRR